MRNGSVRPGRLYGGHNFQRGKRAGDIVYAKDISPVQCSDGNRCLRADFHHGLLWVDIRQVVRFQKFSHKSLPGRPDQYRLFHGFEPGKMFQQEEVVQNGFTKTDTGIDDDLGALNPFLFGRGDSLFQKRVYFTEQIVISG